MASLKNMYRTSPSKTQLTFGLRRFSGSPRHQLQMLCLQNTCHHLISNSQIYTGAIQKAQITFCMQMTTSIFHNVFSVNLWFRCRWSPKSTNYFKWYLCVGVIWVDAHHSHSIQVLIGPMCQSGIFALHVVVHNIQYKHKQKRKRQLNSERRFHLKPLTISVQRRVPCCYLPSFLASAFWRFFDAKQHHPLITKDKLRERLIG